MPADASAYAALGLEPGADAAAIEMAYKRLIKQHHPDREGGDGERAAQINRAYRDICAARHLKESLQLNEEWPADPRAGRAWLAFALMLAAATIGLLLSQSPLAQVQSATGPPVMPIDRQASHAGDPMDQPLDLTAINTAVREAVKLVRTSDEMGLARASRDCHHSLRIDPSLDQLDRCAAFDDAVVQLQDRDPLRDQGPFSELAVTGRIWGGATALSDDSVAIDSRLDRIRLRVEVALAPLVGERPAQASVN